MSSNPGSRIDCIKCLLCIQKPSSSRLMIVLGNYYKQERIPNSSLLRPQNCCTFSKMMRLFSLCTWIDNKGIRLHTSINRNNKFPTIVVANCFHKSSTAEQQLLCTTQQLFTMQPLSLHSIAFVTKATKTEKTKDKSQQQEFYEAFKRRKSLF